MYNQFWQAWPWEVQGPMGNFAISYCVRALGDIVPNWEHGYYNVMLCES